MQIEVQGWYIAGGSAVGIQIGVFDVEVLPTVGTTMDFITNNDYPQIPAGSRILCEVINLRFNLQPGAQYKYWVIVDSVRSTASPTARPATKIKKAIRRRPRPG
jgi:hypothetical protein